ncbi:CLUMA_CG017916, isoform A [Clunio marinus]|uniref:CLUMA_CG017916, isoform A n=1 Tax=Clunio marinus TaxID=568069 RepID=A0A1J1IXI7_9DIPT|nr:CLUMA_CG017916, isoform A [Clunio marinus]
MSFSSVKSSRLTSTLPQQETMSSLSTSLSNLDNTDSMSNVSSLIRQKIKNGNHKKRKKSVEHFVAFCDEKTLKRLKQHYYPEGEWGYVILIVVILVQTINHGLHLSNSIFNVTLMKTFEVTVMLSETNKRNAEIFHIIREMSKIHKYRIKFIVLSFNNNSKSSDRAKILTAN